MTNLEKKKNFKFFNEPKIIFQHLKVKSIGIGKKKKELSIYDRICDHNSGKLISKDGKTFCPMHNWEFVPQTGVYKNGLVKKNCSFHSLSSVTKAGPPIITTRFGLSFLHFFAIAKFKFAFQL